MKKWFLSCLVSLSALYAGEIKLAVAANVSYAMDDLIAAFKTESPQSDVSLVLGSSGKLTAQIKNGAPFELFMAADMQYPKALFKEGEAVTKPVIYAQGALAYLSNKPRDFTKGIDLLTQKEIKKIAIANPKTAPYGVASVEAFEHAGIYGQIKEKLVYGESISQTVAYATQAADIGLIAKSSLYTSQMIQYKEGINWSDVDAKLYTPIDQGMVILKKGEGNAEVKAFYTFMQSAKAKEILKVYGYKVVE